MYIYNRILTDQEVWHLANPIPMDAFVAIDFQSNQGLGKNVVGKYATYTLNLVNSDDTLFLIHSPYDSSGGFLSFSAGGNEDAILTEKTYTTPFTIVMKFRGYNSSSDSATIFKDNSGDIKPGSYYSRWYAFGDDSVTSINSDGEIYRNGIFRFDLPGKLNGTYTTTLDFLKRFEGRLYYIYIYLRKLSIAEMQTFN